MRFNPKADISGGRVRDVGGSGGGGGGGGGMRIPLPGGTRAGGGIGGLVIIILFVVLTQCMGGGGGLPSPGGSQASNASIWPTWRCIARMYGATLGWRNLPASAPSPSATRASAQSSRVSAV